ncbi:hypothetical protein DERP_002314 [Dermatophagoides pteronyssinus]|uniref:Uncharacterized protein n=1 Tax=Dermatophagoides pteronyssinus TaxID=6956 RepID=A0ABQ8JHV4_DERPT|nr:hypothetical protein DERP_002314 [Dermatophagoides pteronyssinus]
MLSSTSTSISSLSSSISSVDVALDNEDKFENLQSDIEIDDNEMDHSNICQDILGDTKDKP